MNFIDPHLNPIITLDKSHNYYLVALSIVIAIISVLTITKTSGRIQASSTVWQKVNWLFSGSLSLGIGIWTMYLISLMSIMLPIPLSFSPGFIFLSLVPIVLASTFCLWLINQGKLNDKKLFFGGLILSLAVYTMHFIGLHALVMNADIVHEKSLVTYSLFFTTLIAIVSLKLLSDAIQQGHYRLLNTKQLIASLVFSCTICWMHYSALHAAVFIPVEKTNSFPLLIDPDYLSIIISLIVFLLLVIFLIVATLFQYKEKANVFQNSDSDLNIAKAYFQTNEAIMVTDERMSLVKVNNAFTTITGYSELEVIGKNPKFLNSGKHDEAFFNKRQKQLQEEEKWQGEVWNRRKNGETFPVWETITPVKDKDNNISHYIQFFSDNTDFKAAKKEIEDLAFYDSLTELPNRRLLCERLEHELNNARRYDRAGILFFLDLDRFKNINDSLGYSVGDEILIKTAQRLQTLLRDTDTAVHLGADEFVILVSAQDGIRTDLLEQSSVIAEKLINTINRPYKIGKYELFITTSIGITLYTGIEETVELLLNRADTAMKQAKESGKNNFRFYQQSMQDAVDIKLKIERNLRLAISKKELSLHYQPQLSDKNEVIAVEALIRWKNDELGKVSPVEFLPIAEETGLIIAIGKWTIETVCQQINLWNEQKIHIPQIAINISAKQFFQSGFVSMLDLIFFEYSIDPNRVILEITEGVFLGNQIEVVDKMEILKARGFSFSIDDFGTGYSSLTYLKDLPFDQLKIDEAFTKNMINQPRDMAIVKALILMAKGLGLNLIAEGVDTDKHLAYLSEFGCHIFQGYYFSKPLPAEQISEYLKQQKIRFDNL